MNIHKSVHKSIHNSKLFRCSSGMDSAGVEDWEDEAVDLLLGVPLVWSLEDAGVLKFMSV